MVYNVTKYRHYLLGRKFSFHVDHSALIYLVSKVSLTGKLARWTLLLEDFKSDIIHRPGVQHAVADYLSLLESREPGECVRNNFLDAQLFRAEAFNTTELDEESAYLWITKMMTFLSTGLPPKGISPDERK